MMMQLLLASDGMTQAKAPIWDIQRMPRRYASVTYRFYTRMGGLSRYTSQIA